MANVVSKEPENKQTRISDLLSFDNVWKLSLLAFMIASLYLQNNFIGKTEFLHTQDKIRQIEMIIGQLEIKSRVDEQQTKTLEMIENRLRNLEQQTAILMSRSNNK